MSTPTIDQRCAAQAHAESQTYYFECPYLLTPDELRSVLTELAALREDRERLDWLAQSFDDAGEITPEQEARSQRTFERVFDGQRKAGRSNKEAVRAAVDAARKEGSNEHRHQKQMRF